MATDSTFNLSCWRCVLREGSINPSCCACWRSGPGWSLLGASQPASQRACHYLSSGLFLTSADLQTCIPSCFIRPSVIIHSPLLRAYCMCWVLGCVLGIRRGRSLGALVSRSYWCLTRVLAAQAGLRRLPGEGGIRTDGKVGTGHSTSRE